MIRSALIAIMFNFSPPANEVWGKVISLQVCVCPQGGCLVRGGVPDGDPRPPNGYCCGRYASYWNAFLFVSMFASNFDIVSMLTLVLMKTMGWNPFFVFASCYHFFHYYRS